jgi:hypothetical protein
MHAIGTLEVPGAWIAKQQIGTVSVGWLSEEDKQRWLTRYGAHAVMYTSRLKRLSMSRSMKVDVDW